MCPPRGDHHPQMSQLKIITLVAITMVAFAGNSLLCRLALQQSQMDPASFTSIRLVSGAAALWLLVSFRDSSQTGRGNWLSAFALFVYAACFSFGYVSLPAATGALLLFGAVQATMISHGIISGERMRPRQVAGLILALSGVVALFLPGISAPPITGSILMLLSGIAWGAYSLRGKGAADPTKVTAGNFLRSIPFAAALSVATIGDANLGQAGIWYAVASGAIASGLGYALWYLVLPSLKSTSAATVQLSVPVIAAFGGILFLAESITPRLVIASVAILGGIALVILEKSPEPGVER